jgi:phosphoenolpyruvate-protein kinase (PTS system EI component)
MDELSASPSLVPRVKLAVQNLSISECEALVEDALRLKSSAEILERCRALAQSRYADLLG